MYQFDVLFYRKGEIISIFCYILFSFLTSFTVMEFITKTKSRLSRNCNKSRTYYFQSPNQGLEFDQVVKSHSHAEVLETGPSFSKHLHDPPDTVLYFIISNSSPLVHKNDKMDIEAGVKISRPRNLEVSAHQMFETSKPKLN